jgi:AcrR family transcriptional regulator
MRKDLPSVAHRPAKLIAEARTRRSPKSGSRASSERTRSEILLAAKTVLATDGFARFSLRRVAGIAGLTVGNLAYHYRSKRDLVHALIESLIDEYRNQVGTYLRSPKSRSPKGFGALVEWMMHDSVSPLTSRLFREFWTIALHDEFIATAIDDFYVEVHETTSQLLRQNFPNLTSCMAQDIVQLMGIISEGSNVLYATARVSTAPMNRVARLASTLLVQAAEQSDS